MLQGAEISLKFWTVHCSERILHDKGHIMLVLRGRFTQELTSARQ